MNDSLDDRLQDAGKVFTDNAEVSRSLADLLDARLAASPKSSRRRVASLAGAAGVLLAMTGAGAVAASQWGPWVTVTDPDVVLERSWTDAEGEWLGDCETRFAMEALPEEVRATAETWLSAQDLDALEPDPQSVAGTLNALGRLDELPRLLPGEQAADYGVYHEGPLWSADWFSDARILQDATTSALSAELAAVIFEASPDLADGGIGSVVETQCTTDPASGTP